MAARIPVRSYARLAGILLLVSMVAGGFGEAWVPMRLIVAGDPAATARNILDSESLFRWGFAGYLVEALCDVALTWVLYVMLRPVHRELALFAVFLRLIATTGFAMGQVLQFTALPILSGGGWLASFSRGQLEALAYLMIRTGLRAGEVFSMFYGAGLLVLGYLIARSGFLPAFLGWLLAITGATFVIKTFLGVLAPGLASPLLLAPAMVAGLALTGWFLVKGVDAGKWAAAAGERRGDSGQADLR